jgi:crotonobetainyl-CoA:carnitine CoA-transferase CaiB-like acyl-CoA transferase
MADAERLLFDEDLKQRAAARFAELLRTRSALDWEIAINEQSGASAALCSTAEYWLRKDSHARENRQVIELEDPVLGPTVQAGYPIRMSKTPPETRGARHALDSDRKAILAELAQPHPGTREPGPEPSLRAALEGIRVLDVSQVLAGPTVSRILAEYGAEVVKIHSFEDRQLGMHLYTNSGKQSVMLNLKTPEGMDIFWQLADGIDVFVENFTRGVCDRMGIGEAALRERNPGIIYAAISAFGRDGYRGGWRGREQLGQGVTGMQARLGGYGEMPLMAPMAYCDYGSGNLAAFGALVALYHRLRTGEGQNVQSSLAHAGTFLQIPYMVAYDGAAWNEPNGQQAKGWGPLDRLYRCEDRWIYLAAPRPRDAERLTEVEGLTDVDGLAGQDLERALAERLATDTAQTWVRRLVAAGIGAHVLMDFTEVMDEERARARGLSLTREHPGVGRVSRLAGPSARLSRTPPRPTRPVGPPGSDTRALLESLGYNDDELEKLIQRDVAREGLAEGTKFVGMFR